MNISKLLLLIGMFCGLAVSQEQSPSNSQQDTSKQIKFRAVQFLRLLNTTEINLHKRGPFLEFDDLKNNGELATISKKFFPGQEIISLEGSDILPGYLVRFNLSKDKMQYQ